MAESMQVLEDHTNSEYKYGFTTDIEMDVFPKGLSEDVVRAISAKKNEPVMHAKSSSSISRRHVCHAEIGSSQIDTL